MKICHMTSVHPYNDIRITVKECNSLVEAGFEVHLIAPNTTVENFQGIKVHGLLNPYKGRFKRANFFTRKVYLKALELDADIYHFHDPELLKTGIMLKKQGKKVIYDVHEDVPRQILNKHWIPKPIRKVTSFAFEKYENNIVRKLDAIVTATPYIEDRFKKYNHNVINVSNFPILNELYIGDKQIGKENSVVYIGGITKERGSLVMVGAIEKTIGTLELAGKFVNENEKKFLEILPSWETKVNYHGFLNREGIKNTLSRSKAGLVVLEPRLNFIDSLPIKMFEYMAAGIPVIASDFPVWKEIIEMNKCGICVDPLNVEEISKAIQWIFSNPQEATTMGENGRRAIETIYNWETESEKLIKLYETLN